MIVYLLIVLVFGVAYFVLLSKYAQLWSSIEPPQRIPPMAMAVSLIIPFRNEEENIPALIRSINQQKVDGIDVEIVWVDDHSTDASVDTIAHAQNNFKNIVVSLENDIGKKAALHLGWETASGDIILQTDADCIFDEDWIQQMATMFGNPKTTLVSGPVKFYKPQNFWQKMVYLDFVVLIATGAAHIAWHRPLMCNGANMAYRKSILKNVNMKEGSASGDDVFLLQSAFNQSNESVAFCKTKKAMVTTIAPESFGQFWNQRIRWSSKNSEYDSSENKSILLFLWLYNLLILGSVLSLSAMGVTVALFLVILKVLAEDKLYTQVSEFFDVRSWFRTILLGQPFHILYMAILPPLSQILKYQWKDRKLK